MRTATVYNFLLEANLMASIAILLMLPIRRFLRGRLGNRAIYFAWLLVAIRLLCPLSLPNPAINEIRPMFAQDLAIRPIASQLQIRFSDTGYNIYNWVSAHSAPDDPLVEKLNTFVDDTYNGLVSLRLMQIYVLGIGVILCWFLISNLRFRRRLKADRIEPISGRLLEQYQAMCAQRGVKPIPVYFTDPLPSACLVGIIDPYIALPLTAPPQEVIQVLTHEICHYRGKDHLWAMLRLLCCAFHWFNPLVWIAAGASRTDCELACDDRVVEKLNDKEKLVYANVLVLAASKRNAPGVAVLATGMTMTGRKLKTRVRSILHREHIKKGFALAFALLACMALVGAFATSEYRASPQIPNLPATSALPAEKIVDVQSAINYAKAIWANAYVNEDMTNAQWRVNYRNGAYVVEATLPGLPETLDADFLPDGSLIQLNNSNNQMRYSAALPSLYTGQTEMQKEMIDYLQRFVVTFNPSISNQIQSITFVDEIGFNSFYYVLFVGSDETGDTAYQFTVQVLPYVRVIQFTIEKGHSNG